MCGQCITIAIKRNIFERTVYTPSVIARRENPPPSPDPEDETKPGLVRVTSEKDQRQVTVTSGAW